MLTPFPIIHNNNGPEHVENSLRIPVEKLKSLIFYRVINHRPYNPLATTNSASSHAIQLNKNDILYLDIAANKNRYHKNVQYLWKVNKIHSGNEFVYFYKSQITLTPEFIEANCKKCNLLEAKFKRPVCFLGPFTGISF